MPATEQEKMYKGIPEDQSWIEGWDKYRVEPNTYMGEFDDDDKPANDAS